MTYLLRARLYFVLIVLLAWLAAGVVRAQDPPRAVAPIYTLEHAVEVDGKVTDWEWAPSLGLGKYATPIRIEKWGTVARFWARYDTQYLYVAFRVEDASPAINMRQGNMRWEGDQVELCLCTDPENHLKHGDYGEYDYQLFIGPTGDGTASVYVNINGAKKDIILPGSKAALTIRPDKQGYDLEAQIPWASLNRPAYFQPKAGVEIGWQIQIDFGPTDGGTIMGGVAYVAKWYPYGIHFQHPNSWAWARLLAPDETIFAQEPTATAPRKPAGSADLAFTTPVAGKVSVNVMRPDNTLVRRVVIGQQMDAGAHTVNWDGYDEDGKPASAGNYRFIGSVSNMGVKYLATVGNTSPEPYGGCRKAVGGEYRHGCFTHVLMNPDGTFYMLNNGGEGPPSIQLIDPAKNFAVIGSANTATAGSEFAVAGARDGDMLYFNHGSMFSRYDTKTQLSQRFTNGAWSINILGNAADGPALGLAACKGKVFVPLFGANRVDIYDGTTGGKIGAITEPGFANPTDACAAADGTLYVVDRLAVRRFTPEGKYLDTPVQGLTSGRAVAVGPGGEIYVSDDGTHQVLVFDKAGKFLKAFGPVGGATVRDKGPLNLWSTPTQEWVGGKVAPDRFFHPWGLGVDAQGNLVVVDSGNVRIQYFDKRGQLRKSIIAQMYASMCVDPANPETVFICSEQGIMRQYRMDWATGKHELQAQWAPTPTHFQYVKWHNGQPYFFSSRAPVMTIENGKLRICTDADGKPLNFALWGHCFHVKDNWDIINQTVGGERDFVFLRYPFKGFDARKNPIYGPPQTAFAGSKVDADWNNFSDGKPRKSAVGGYDVADDGMVFLVANDRPEFVPVDCRFRAYTPDGKRLWSIGRSTKGFWTMPGVELSFAMHMPNSLDDKVFIGEATGVVHVFTRNALYLGTICEGGDWPPALKGTDLRMQPQGEMWWSHIFRDARTKRIYAVMMPNAAPLVMTYEVTGLDEVKAIAGECVLVVKNEK